jgi:hypothetical protein
MRKCNTCGEFKADTEFSRDRRAPDGRQRRCLACSSAARRCSYNTNTAGGVSEPHRDESEYRPNPLHLAAAKVLRRMPREEE